MLTVIVVLKAITEIAILALIGQAILGLMAGPNASGNVFYGVLNAMTLPVRKLAGVLTPPALKPRFVGFVAFCLLAAGWIALTLAKVRLVLGG